MPNKGRNKRLVIVNGTMGVGKSATCNALLEKLEPAAYLDGDWCWKMQPWSANERSIEMVEQNICFLLRQYLSNPQIENVIFAWVLHRDDILHRLVKQVQIEGMLLSVFTLVCSASRLKERLVRDIEQGVRAPDIVERSLQKSALYRQMTWPKIDTSDISSDKAADRIVDMMSSSELSSIDYSKW